MTEEDSIGAKICYGETDLFLVVLNLQIYNRKFLYLASGIMSTIGIVYLEQAWEVMGLNPILDDKVFMN